MAGSARSPIEKKSAGKAMTPHFLLQLTAALDNPLVKSLEWHEDGKSILLHAKSYEEEIQGNEDLFPELKNLRSVPVLQTWLTTSGFKARTTKTDTEVLIFQHADYKKLPPKAEEVDGSKAEIPPIPKQPKKSKKRKSSLDIIVSSTSNIGSILSPESAGKSQRLRPLYQYINYSNPEMNSPSEKECDPPPLEIPPALENKTRPIELRINPPKVAEDPRNPRSASLGAAVKAEVDKSTQVDIDKMLSVCAAHLVPPLSPQHK